MGLNWREIIIYSYMLIVDISTIYTFVFLDPFEYKSNKIRMRTGKPLFNILLKISSLLLYPLFFSIMLINFIFNGSRIIELLDSKQFQTVYKRIRKPKMFYLFVVLLTHLLSFLCNSNYYVSVIQGKIPLRVSGFLIVYLVFMYQYMIIFAIFYYRFGVYFILNAYYMKLKLNITKHGKQNLFFGKPLH